MPEPTANRPAPAGVPVVIPPPGPVRIAALLAGLEGVGLLVLAVVTFVSGLSHDARLTQLIAQAAYFVVLGAAVILVAAGLLRGRRWARSPAIVVQVVVIAVGMWMAFPSDQLGRGLALIGLGALTFGLLCSPRANHWIKQFPTPFGLGREG